MDPEEPTQPSQNPEDYESGRMEGVTQASASSFGEPTASGPQLDSQVIPNSQVQMNSFPDQNNNSLPQDRQNIFGSRASALGSQRTRSDLLSTQLSVNSHQSAISRRRGDINPSGALERYLASDLRSEVRPTSPAHGLSSQGGDPFGAAPVIWGTTVNIEDSMALFKDFISNFRLDEMDQDPFYASLLLQVCVA